MAKYPSYLNQVKDLVEQHRELVEEPLLLAIYYAPDRNPEDVFLFEILDNFRGGALDTSGDILEVLYGQTELFVLEQRNAMLHILLSNPDEFCDAAARGTMRMIELREAFGNGKAQIVYDNGTCNVTTQPPPPAYSAFSVASCTLAENIFLEMESFG